MSAAHDTPGGGRVWPSPLPMAVSPPCVQHKVTRAWPALCAGSAPGAASPQYCVGLCELADVVDPSTGSGASLAPAFGWSVLSDGTATAGSSTVQNLFPALVTSGNLAVGPNAQSVHVLGVGVLPATGRVFFSVNGVVYWSTSTLSREDMTGRRFFVRTHGSGIQFHITTGPRFLVPLDILFTGMCHCVSLVCVTVCVPCGCWNLVGSSREHTVVLTIPLCVQTTKRRVPERGTGRVRRLQVPTNHWPFGWT